MKKLLSALTFIVLLLAPAVNKAQKIYLGPQVGSVAPQVYGVLGTVYGGTGTVPSCHASNNALIYNDSVSPPEFDCNTISGSGGTVTEVSPTGSNSMFVLSVADQTTTPEISIALSNATNQIFVGTGSGTGSWNTLPNCVGGTSALNYNNSTHAFSCASISGGGSTTNSLTANSSGGASPGASFNGSSPVTIDYHTVGAPSASGTGASGTWGINISGQASYVANGLTFDASGSGASPSTVYNGASAYLISYNTIGAPSVTGSGASGTWAIAISGNAATATALASAPTSCTASTQFAYGIGANGNALCANFFTAVVRTNCLTTSCVGGTTYSSGTSFTNLGTTPVEEEVGMTASSISCTGADSELTYIVDGATGYGNGVWNQCNGVAGVTFIVPAGSTFSATATHIDGGGSAAITSWTETPLPL